MILYRAALTVFRATVKGSLAAGTPSTYGFATTHGEGSAP
jgi:hypothetical protein